MGERFLTFRSLVIQITFKVTGWHTLRLHSCKQTHPQMLVFQLHTKRKKDSFTFWVTNQNSTKGYMKKAEFLASDIPGNKWRGKM